MFQGNSKNKLNTNITKFFGGDQKQFCLMGFAPINRFKIQFCVVSFHLAAGQWSLL